MQPASKTINRWIVAMLLFAGLIQTACQSDRESERSMPIVSPVSAPYPSALPASASPVPAPASQVDRVSNVMVYINMKLDKKYGTLARLVGGMRNTTWESTTYDPAKPWWNNPLIAYAEPPLFDPDVIARADSQPMTGHGVSKNVVVDITLMPYADLAVKTIPGCDAIHGSITVTISTSSEYYDGRWVNLVREEKKKLTFTFDTRDPLRPLEIVGHETRTIPPFALERFTRDEKKWEPKSNWPQKAQSGDWRVVIYGENPTLQVTGYRYVEETIAEHNP